MAFRTILTNPQEIPIFESKNISLVFHSKDLVDDLTPFTLDLSRLSSELKQLNPEYILSLVGTSGQNRVDEDLCSVADLLKAPSLSWHGELQLRGKRPNFLIYFHAKSSLKIQATSQAFHGKFISTVYESMLPVLELENSTSIWEYELDDEDGPILKINKDVTDIETRLRTDKLWQGLIIPITLKRGFEFLIKHWDEEDKLWTSRWKSQISALCGDGTLEEAPLEEDATIQDVENWVHPIVERFTSGNRFIEHVNYGENSEENE